MSGVAMADFPVIVPHNADAPRIAKYARELHAYLQHQPVSFLFRFQGAVDFPIDITPPDGMRLPRVVSANARTHPDDATNLSISPPDWAFDPTRQTISIKAIDGLTPGTAYTIDFAITGSRD